MNDIEYVVYPIEVHIWYNITRESATYLSCQPMWSHGS